MDVLNPKYEDKRSNRECSLECPSQFRLPHTLQNQASNHESTDYLRRRHLCGNHERYSASGRRSRRHIRQMGHLSRPTPAPAYPIHRSPPHADSEWTARRTSPFHPPEHHPSLAPANRPKSGPKISRCIPRHRANKPVAGWQLEGLIEFSLINTNAALRQPSTPQNTGVTDRHQWCRGKTQFYCTHFWK